MLLEAHVPNICDQLGLLIYWLSIVKTVTQMVFSIFNGIKNAATKIQAEWPK